MRQWEANKPYLKIYYVWLKKKNNDHMKSELSKFILNYVVGNVKVKLI